MELSLFSLCAGLFGSKPGNPFILIDIHSRCPFSVQLFSRCLESEKSWSQMENLAWYFVLRSKTCRILSLKQCLSMLETRRREIVQARSKQPTEIFQIVLMKVKLQFSVPTTGITEVEKTQASLPPHVKRNAQVMGLYLGSYPVRLTVLTG